MALSHSRKDDIDVCWPTETGQMKYEDWKRDYTKLMTGQLAEMNRDLKAAYLAGHEQGAATNGAGVRWYATLGGSDNLMDVDRPLDEWLENWSDAQLNDMTLMAQCGEHLLCHWNAMEAFVRMKKAR